MTSPRNGASRALCLLLAGMSIQSPVSVGPSSSVHAQAAAIGVADVAFEPNRGQFEPEFAFVAMGPGYRVGLQPGGATWLVPAGLGRPVERVRFSLVDARRGELAAGDPLASRSHYARGRDPRGWTMNVPHFGSVRERGLYPGIDLVYRARGVDFEYDFELAPGADPASIRLRFDGALSLRLDEGGDLIVRTSGGEMRQARPIAFQEKDGAKQPVGAAYTVRGLEVAVALGAYDRKRPLVIDPVVSYSSFIGSANWDEANDVAVDAAGNAYVVGGAAPSGWKDVVVTKVGAGGHLAYRTFLTGTGGNPESGHSIAVDAAGNAYLTGWTSSWDYPLRGQIQFYGEGDQDAFVTKLDPSGLVVYSTYLGGNGEDHGSGIAVDDAGQAYVVGWTSSANFPVAGAAQATRRGAEDAFVAKLSADGSSLVFSTYLGGTGNEAARGVAWSATTGAHVVGRTTSTDFPLVSALQSTFGGGADDSFITRFSEAGAIVSSTYRGGVDAESATDIALDASGAVYVTGWAARLPAQALGFVEKFSPGVTSLVYSTYGRGGDGIAVDGAGNAFATGGRINLSFDAGYYPPPGDAFFFSKLGASGAPVSDFGGTGGLGIALDGSGQLIVVGRTSSTLFPTWHAFQPAYAGNNFKLEGFVAKIAPDTVATAGIEENDPAVTYTGTWVTDTTGSWSGGSGRRSTEAGARATLAFTGTGVAVLGRRGPGGGRLRVSVDASGPYQNLDLPLAATALESRALLLSITGLTSGAHTLRLDVVGDGTVWLDGFNIETGIPAPTPTPRVTPTVTPTPLPRASATPTPTPTSTPTPTVPPRATVTPTPTPPARPTLTPTPGPTSTPTPVPPPVVRYEDPAPENTYTGTWFTNGSSLHSASNAHLSVDPGDRATLSFTGTGVALIGYQDEWSGIGRMWLDGVSIGNVDFYRTPQRAQSVLHTVTGLPFGTHTFAVEVTGTRNPASGGNAIWIDAFDVTTGSGATPTATPTPPPTMTPTPRPGPTATPTPTMAPPTATPTPTATPAPTATTTPTPRGTPPSVTRYEDTHPAVVYAETGGTWFTNTAAVHSASNAHMAVDPGNRATFTFSGTGVSLVAYQDEWSGIGRVLIDGVLNGTADFYRSPARAQAVVYTVSGLAAGTHTIAVEVTGTRSPGSANNWIWIDAFDVTP